MRHDHKPTALVLLEIERRAARRLALGLAAGAGVFGIGTGLAMRAGQEGAAAVLGLAAYLILWIAAAVAIEA